MSRVIQVSDGPSESSPLRGLARDQAVDQRRPSRHVDGAQKPSIVGREHERAVKALRRVLEFLDCRCEGRRTEGWLVEPCLAKVEPSAALAAGPLALARSRLSALTESVVALGGLIV